MNLDTCNAGQRASIEHLEGPLFIAAGAGSGKTFTLQQRIAYALMEESGPVLSSIDEVLAITFMEKAAAEVKARVRNVLRNEGMNEEALKVDAAWISTIHGMCSRILRENALVAGVDPGFSVVLDFKVERLRADAIEEVLSDESARSEYGLLFEEYGVRSKGNRGVAVYNMLVELLDKSMSFTGGLDAVSLFEGVSTPSKIAKDLLVAYEKGLALIEAHISDKSGVLMQKTLVTCQEAVDGLADFLETGAQDWRTLGKLLGSIGSVPKNGFGKDAGETGGEMSFALKSELARAFKNLNIEIAKPCAVQLVSLAKRVEKAYQRKLDEQGALDNDALLRRTHRLLTEHPEIARRYQQRFKLVMVDEFQDTNQMQVDLIKLVAGTNRLCTVGDAEQSIYRFNGADVSVFERQRKAVVDASAQGEFALVQKLDKNYRSHTCILEFVRFLFTRGLASENFLDLAAERRETGAFKGDTPRIELQLCNYDGNKDACGVVDVEAAAIAKRFASLRDAGHKASEMVVLLGKMANAVSYAAALRSEGFKVVIGGGRSFFELAEVAVVRDVLLSLANPRDTQSLFGALTSQAIMLSADDFLQMATCADKNDGHLKSRSIGIGLFQVGDDASEALHFASELYKRAFGKIRWQRPSQVVTEFLEETGWFIRLEEEGVEGTAKAANVMKAIRIIEELEQTSGYAFARVARDFLEMSQSVADAPGSLAVSGQDAVRIMTIHKSKGLEFPIVAVADYDSRKSGGGAFSLTACDSSIYLSLSAKESAWTAPSSVSSEYRPECADPREAVDGAEFQAAVKNRENEEDFEEVKRKFYVACTRASEYLLVCGKVSPKKTVESTYSATPVLDAIRQSFMGDADFPEENAELNYRGSERLRFVRIVCGSSDAGCDDADNAGVASREGERCLVRTVPVLESSRSTVLYPAASLSVDDTFSYSSISSFKEASRDKTELTGRDSEPTAGETFDAGEADGSAADRGTAFHRLAQYAVGHRSMEGALVRPDGKRIDAIARRYGLGASSRSRLEQALGRWFESSAAKAASRYKTIRAEVPFLVEVPVGGAVEYLQGEIDLLAFDDEAKSAYVVDYKTGGHDGEDTEELQCKHRLQATCYAYALLNQGFKAVELSFVRVERCDPENPGEPQVVSYRFESQDKDSMLESIANARMLSLDAMS